MKPIKLSIPEETKAGILSGLAKVNKAFHEIYPGDKPDRQPVHTVYGGAHLFKSDTTVKMGEIALKHFRKYAPDHTVLGRLLQLNPDRLACTVYDKIIQKLEREPVEDFRIDFEDGFGNRSDEEEDTAAQQAANETAKGMKDGSLPPFIGIRVKPFTEDLKERSVKTLDIYLSALLEETGGKLPANFLVMLPKVTIPEHVQAMVKLFEALESANNLNSGTLKMEMMVETTQAVINSKGENPLRKFIEAGNGRLISAAFGTYDYTASNNITAKYQDMGHPVCDFAHFMMKVALGSTGVLLSDGATNIMPVAPHKGENLTVNQEKENRVIVHKAWKLGYDHNRHSLYKGLYQGWDLNPAQLPMRYAAVYAFFLESYEEAALRLKKFIESSAKATITGGIFDDAATGQGLLNYFLQALNCAAISEQEAMVTGLTLEEIRSRSFLKILESRKYEVLSQKS